jgi:hypothetical protein
MRPRTGRARLGTTRKEASRLATLHLETLWIRDMTIMIGLVLDGEPARRGEREREGAAVGV